MRRPKKTVSINLSDYLSAGTYSVKIKSKGTDIRDSEDSNSVSCVVAASGYEVELNGSRGLGETVYVQINSDTTWYHAQLSFDGTGFSIDYSNIPNAYANTSDPTHKIIIPNVAKIKFGTSSAPDDRSGPYYDNAGSTGDFVGLTFTSTGGSAPAYATSEITMTQDSSIHFIGDD